MSIIYVTEPGIAKYCAFSMLSIIMNEIFCTLFFLPIIKIECYFLDLGAKCAALSSHM